MLENADSDRARYIMLRMIERATAKRVSLPSLTSTDYVNTIPTTMEPEFPGDEDGDLVDGLVDATRALAEDGQIWLVTPGAGQAGTVPPGDIAENAQLAGLVQTSALRLGDWQGSCLVQRGVRRN